MDPDLRTAFEAHREHVDRGLESTVAGLRQDIASWTTALREDMTTSVSETRRHFDVVAESLRADIPLVAKGVTAGAERGDRLEAGLQAQILGAQRDHLEVPLARLEGGR